MVGILAIVSSTGNRVHHIHVFHSLRVQIMDGIRITNGVVSASGQHSDNLVGFEFDLPLWGFVLASMERWVQWNWGVGFQFHPQWCIPIHVLEFLRQNALDS